MEAREIDPARPEPMPVNQLGGFEVVPTIIREFTNKEFWQRELIEGGKTLITWLHKRSDFGFKKYNARLTCPNGRDFHKDLCDELADAVNYARGAVEAGQISPETYIDIVIIADRVINEKG
jgi:hypothetical protein